MVGRGLALLRKHAMRALLPAPDALKRITTRVVLRRRVSPVAVRLPDLYLCECAKIRTDVKDTLLVDRRRVVARELRPYADPDH